MRTYTTLPESPLARLMRTTARLDGHPIQFVPTERRATTITAATPFIIQQMKEATDEAAWAAIGRYVARNSMIRGTFNDV